MGKRSTSTTKSGKYMNPTDQARKEARRRELKKNKKQRIDPEEDLHLQDLTHPEPEVRDDFRDEKERKKHNTCYTAAVVYQVSDEWSRL